MRFALLLILFMGFFTTLKGAEVVRDTLSAREAFVKVPSRHLDLIDPPLRLDMLDYWDVDSIAHVKNNMDGRSWLTVVTPTFLGVHLTEVSSFGLKVLPSDNGGIVATTYTIDGEGEADDTSLLFYDAQMKPLKMDKIISYPELKDFFSLSGNAKLKMSDVREAIPFITVRFDLSPDSTDLSARLTVGEYLDKETFDALQPYMHRNLTYIWDGKRYKLNKK